MPRSASAPLLAAALGHRLHNPASDVPGLLGNLTLHVVVFVTVKVCIV